MGGPWIKSQEEPFFQCRDKTSEYSEIYREQLTSEHFLPYNYRSSTLPRISRNIGRLLRQCSPPARNVASSWAATRGGVSDSSPSILDFMSLYDICVATGHIARVSVNHTIGYQDVTIFFSFPMLTNNSNKFQTVGSKCAGYFLKSSILVGGIISYQLFLRS